MRGLGACLGCQPRVVIAISGSKMQLFLTRMQMAAKRMKILMLCSRNE